MHDVPDARRAVLVQVVRTVYQSHSEELQHVKVEATQTGADPSSLWEGLVRSAATWGNARGLKTLMEKPELHDRVRWESLDPLSPTERHEQILETLTKAGIRMAERKAGYLSENFERIHAEGGEARVKERLESIPGRDGKIGFLRTFRGVGPKYARNIMMDGYHQDFRDSIAIDQRIQGILKELGRPFNGDYEETEDFLLSVAGEAGLEGWEVDRLLFLYSPEVLKGIRQARESALKILEDAGKL